jgi:imidazole glycerol-phosphate synthase subunit HisH
MKKVGIIDYNLGNLFSVCQACKEVGIHIVMCKEAHDLDSLDAFILPGVGSFKEAMNNMRKSGMDKALVEEVKKGKPLFGICLGLQLLFDWSEEFGETKGLGILNGRVKKFPDRTANGEKIRIPNIGWNSVKIKESRITDDTTPLSEISENDHVYFVHSYYVETKNKEYVLSTTNYGSIDYPSSVLLGNIFATQFHPEKSAEKGLSIYRNWATSNKLI